MKEKAKKIKFFSSVHPAVVTVWAAIIAVSNILPSIPLLGVGGTLSVSNCFVPLAGILLGPYAGALAAGLGNFIGQLIAPVTAVFGIGTFLIGMVNALAAGWLTEGKWIQAGGVSVLSILLWFTHPIGRKSVLMAATFHGSGLAVGLFCGLVAFRWLRRKNLLLKTVAVCLISYSSLVIAHCYADYAALILWSMPAITWKMLAFTAPVERLFFAIGAMIIGMPLLIGLPKIGIYVGPEPEEPAEAEAGEDEP